ncbi:MAG: WD40 repeat protein [Cycloclasticus sp.]|jgi:WD40 repeat protein
MTKFTQLLTLIYFLILLSACQYESVAEQTWTHSEKGLFTASYSKDGQYVLVAATGGPAHLIETSSNTPLHQWQHTESNDGIIASAISANNKFAITAEKNSLALWETVSGKIIGYWGFPTITDIAISADGKRALISMENNEAYYFDLYFGKVIYTFEHDGIINTVALSNNGEYALTGGNDHHAKLWNLKTGQVTQQWSHSFKVFKVALSDNGRYAMTNASLRKTRLWDTQTGVLLSQLPMRYMTVSAGVFSPDSESLLTGRPNQRIDLWDVKTGELLNTWLPQQRNFWLHETAVIIALAFSSDGLSFFSEATNGSAQKWKISKK